MTIRARLVLWYFGILLFGLMLLTGWGYYEMVVAHPEVNRALVANGHSPWEEFGELLLVAVLPALVLAMAGGWLLMRRALLPIATLTQAVERMQAQTLHQRLPRSGNRDELDRLTAGFNAMVARLEDSFAHVREFTLHASHELKTPLTVMRAEMETALGEGRYEPEQRELLANQLDEIQRLARIVDSLAFLAQADGGQVTLSCEPLRFDELVKDIFDDALVLARPQGVAVELKVCEEVVLRGDRHRLRQLLLNLADNAIKYNQPHGSVVMALSRNNGTAELRIANTGAGIPPEKLPRVFDRFFRGDPSHNSAMEGCGLGLNIAQWIVKAHNGSIQIASLPERMTTVVVSLPVDHGSEKPLAAAARSAE